MGGNKTEVIQARITFHDRKRLRVVLSRLEMTESEYARDALLARVRQDERKINKGELFDAND